jgi:hypothetical protein
MSNGRYNSIGPVTVTPEALATANLATIGVDLLFLGEGSPRLKAPPAS